MEVDYFKELELNIKHQKIDVKTYCGVGYEVVEGAYVFILFLPTPFNFKEYETKRTD